MKTPSVELSMLIAIAGAVAVPPMKTRAQRHQRPTDDSEALKSANAKINKVRQDRHLRLLKEREVRSLNFREQRELYGHNL